MKKKARYQGPGCSANNKLGFPCWAPPTHKNPLHEQMPLCWTHLAMLAIAGYQRQQELLEGDGQMLALALTALAELNTPKEGAK